MATITIESGEYKSIFTITEKENGEESVKIDFIPQLNLHKENISNDEAFVGNMSGLLIQALKG